MPKKSGKAALIPFNQVDLILKLLEDGKAESRVGCQLKYKTIFGIGIYTALRIGEIITLKYNDVYTLKGTVEILRVKRLKKRGKNIYSEININPRLKKILLEYRKQYDDMLRKQEAKESDLLGYTVSSKVKTNPFLFPSNNKDGFITYVQVDKKFDEVFKLLNLNKCSTHSMRRTALTKLKNEGVPLSVIADISGHESLEGLKVYLETDPQEIELAMNRIKY